MTEGRNYCISSYCKIAVLRLLTAESDYPSCLFMYIWGGINNSFIKKKTKEDRLSMRFLIILD